MNWYLITALGLFILGLLFFFFLASRKKYRDPSAAPNYERIRNKVTLRELEPKPKKVKEYSGSGGGFLANIIAGFVTILIGTSLIPVITNEISKGTCGSEIMNVSNSLSNICVSGASQEILKTVPFFFTIAILFMGLAIAYSGIKNSGLL